MLVAGVHRQGYRLNPQSNEFYRTANARALIGRWQMTPRSARRHRPAWVETCVEFALKCLVLMWVAAVAAGPALIPHKATYLLSKGYVSPESTVSTVSGRLEVSFEASCEGWRMEQHLGFRLYDIEGDALEHLAQLSGFESVSGDYYWFTTRSFEDRQLTEQLSGQARMDSTASGGSIKYAKPHPTERRLPAGTLFPSGHIRALIAAASSGKRSLRRVVFDGSSLESPFEISAFIGPAGEHAPASFDLLKSERHWPIRLAYFSMQSLDGLPEFEMSLKIFENGVAGDMVYDYGDFSMKATLSDLELGIAPRCTKD